MKTMYACSQYAFNVSFMNTESLSVSMPWSEKLQLSANFCQQRARERLLAHQQRGTLRPTGRNIREHQRLDKTSVEGPLWAIDGQFRAPLP